jgi:hypothetical protein
MTSKQRTIVFNALIWAGVIVITAAMLKGTPFAARVIPVLSLGGAASFSLLVGKKAE